MATETDKQTVHVVVRGGAGNFQQEVIAGKHHLVADEPVSVGGGDAGPDPYDYLLTALGVCTSMTIGLYARRNRLPLENITVSLSHSRIYAADCEECETKEGMLDRIDVEVELTGSLTRRTARETDAGRSQMSRSSDAHIRDQHQIASRGETAARQKL